MAKEEYDKLIADLREESEWAEGNEWETPIMLSDHLKQAADAIEVLQTYKTCFDNIVRIGGWWLVGQDKNLHCMDVPMDWPPRGTKTVELSPLPEPPKEET